MNHEKSTTIVVAGIAGKDAWRQFGFPCLSAGDFAGGQFRPFSASTFPYAVNGA